MSNSKVESLNAGIVLLGDLEKNGWVVLKSGYNTTSKCDFENAFYDLNNDNSTKNTKWYSIDRKKRQIFYKRNGNVSESRFITGDISETHELLKNDCKSLTRFFFIITSLIWKTIISIIIGIRLGIKGLLKLINIFIIIFQQVLKRIIFLVKIT